MASIVLLVVANFYYLTRGGVIYDFLFGKGSPLDLIQSSHTTFSAINQAVFGNPILNKVLFVAFWMMIGLFVYVTLMAIGTSIANTEKSVESMHYIHARRALVEQHLLLRIALQTGGLLAGFMYVWVMLRFLFPFSVFASRVGIGQLSNVMGWLYVALGFIILVLSLHAGVIISRLIAARPRLFGGWDSLLLNSKKF